MSWVKNVLVMLVLCGTVTACSSIQFDELASSGAAAGAAVGTAVVTTNPVLIGAAAVTAGVATSAATPASGDGIDLNLVPEEKRAGVAKYQATLDLIKQFGWWIALGLGAWFFVPLIIGYFIPNGKHRKLHKDAFNDPTKKM